MDKAITIVEMSGYLRKSEKMLSQGERRAVIDYLALHPESGDIMRGTGGIRKLRWGRGGSGKSGGVRVVYYYFNETMPLFLLALFAKNEKDNLSESERNELAKLTEKLREHYGA